MYVHIYEDLERDVAYLTYYQTKLSLGKREATLNHMSYDEQSFWLYQGIKIGTESGSIGAIEITTSVSSYV